MKKILKKILQSSFGFVMGAILFTIIGVKATPSFVLSSEEVEYDNTLSGAAATTVRQALDYLNNKADTLLAEQEGNNNNDDEYASYAVGDTITFKGDSYHVLAASGSNQDYVTLLKDEPLTVSERDTYGSSISFQSYDSGSYGGMDYGTPEEYTGSYVETVVNAWASDKFTSIDLKEVEGYKARLITLDELLPYYPNCTEDVRQNNLGCDVENVTPSWLYDSSYWYWTMTPSITEDFVWYIDGNGAILDYPQNDGDRYLYGGVVRPVINLNKSVLNS